MYLIHNIFLMLYIYIYIFLDITAANADVTRLQGLVTESRTKLDHLADKIKQEWENWIIEQQVKLAFQIVTTISFQNKYKSKIT